MGRIRSCTARDFDRIVEIINMAAEAYRGVIPPDHWHEPYMPASMLAHEVALGIQFHGYVEDGRLVGVMGIQRRGEHDIIRHAYVLPVYQGRGIGGMLLDRLRRASDRPVLIGTWADAAWAIRFYERHGFRVVAPPQARQLLETHWDISRAQMDVSVVLAESGPSIAPPSGG